MYCFTTMPQWPTWCLILLGSLCAAICIIHVYRPHIHMPAMRSETFRRFQWQYLLVYLMVMIVDWTQVISKREVYSEYKEMSIFRQKIANLPKRFRGNSTSVVGVWTNESEFNMYSIGYMSAAVFSLLGGEYIDSVGRKKSCILYCILEIMVNILAHFSDTTILLIDHILSGMSTTLLFTAFQSWMIHEHRRLGFHERLLKYTTALVQITSAVAAIIACMATFLLTEQYGKTGPFRMSVLLSVAVAIYVYVYWVENCGYSSMKIIPAARTIFRDRPLAWLCIVQAFVESTSYVWAFFCAEALDTKYKKIVLASFMLSKLIGGYIFQILVVGKRVSGRRLGVPALFLASISLAIVAHSDQNFTTTIVGFLIFQMALGIYTSIQYSLQNELIPSDSLASIMTAMRVPGNIITAAGIWYSGRVTLSTTLSCCAACVGLSALCHTRIQKSQLNKLP